MAQDRRLLLHQKLSAIEGVTKAYFQPPANVQMEYPAIVYEHDKTATVFAGNLPYGHTKGYQVTVIDRVSDSKIPDRVAALPRCSFSRAYVANNLHHSVFNLYF